MMSTSSEEQAYMSSQRSSWWSRNWKWFVPVGCLGILLFPVACMGGLAFLLFDTVTGNEVYVEAMARARANPAIVEGLGEPVEAGWQIEGNFDLSHDNGSADVVVPLKGPDGRGTLYIEAEKLRGEWNYLVMEVEIAGGDQLIDLLDSDDSSDAGKGDDPAGQPAEPEPGSDDPE
jgi:hypothetical protein